MCRREEAETSQKNYSQKVIYGRKYRLHMSSFSTRFYHFVNTTVRCLDNKVHSRSHTLTHGKNLSEQQQRKQGLHPKLLAWQFNRGISATALLKPQGESWKQPHRCRCIPELVTNFVQVCVCVCVCVYVCDSVCVLSCCRGRRRSMTMRLIVPTVWSTDEV